jgi:hypothetical protein
MQDVVSYSHVVVIVHPHCTGTPRVVLTPMAAFLFR